MRMVRPDEPSKSRSDACGTLFWLREMSRYRTFEVSAVGRPTAQKRSESRLLPSPRRIVLLAGPHSAIVSASPPSKCGGARLRGGPSSRLCLFGLRRLRRPMRLQPMSVSRTAVWRTSGSGRSRCRVARGAGSPEVPGRPRCRVGQGAGGLSPAGVRSPGGGGGPPPGGGPPGPAPGGGPPGPAL